MRESSELTGSSPSGQPQNVEPPEVKKMPTISEMVERLEKIPDKDLTAAQVKCSECSHLSALNFLSPGRLGYIPSHASNLTGVVKLHYLHLFVVDVWHILSILEGLVNLLRATCRSLSHPFASHVSLNPVA